MAKLYDLGNRRYRMTHSKFGLREGSLRDICSFAILELDMEYKEIEAALLDMNDKGHDAADFGIFGGFISSFNSKEVANVG